MEMSTVDLETRMGSKLSSLGTGGGTDHDNASIIARPTYRWEMLLNNPQGNFQRATRRFWCKMGTWLGLSPIWMGRPSQSVGVDVQLDSRGRYVLLDHTS
jgi:hypothetical protein